MAARSKELESIRRAEIESLDTQEAIRQIFGDADLVLPPPSPTSGLVEQQMWFARLHAARYPQMSALFDAARDLQASFEMRGWKFCFIGGLAVLRWGEPRFTRDVDVTMLCPFGSEDEVSTPLLDSGYRGRVSDARALM